MLCVIITSNLQSMWIMFKTILFDFAHHPSLFFFSPQITPLFSPVAMYSCKAPPKITYYVAMTEDNSHLITLNIVQCFPSYSECLLQNVKIKFFIDIVFHTSILRMEHVRSLFPQFLFRPSCTGHQPLS
jgi:hypothetical protein